MSIALANLTSGDGGASPNSTASISPTNGGVVFVWVVWAMNTVATLSASNVSGCGLTWTLIQELPYASRRVAQLWAGTGTPSSGQLTLTATPSTGSIVDCLWIVDESTGLDGTTPYGTRYTNTATGTQTISVTVSETPDTGDFVYSVVAVEGSSATITVGSELSNLLQSVNTGSDVRGVASGYNSSPDSTPTPTYNWDVTSDSAIVGVVLNVASAPAVTLEQEGFRFRNDDGSESAATWKASQDTNIDQPKNENFRLRTLVNATGDPASSAFRLEYLRRYTLIDHLSSGDLGSPTVILSPGASGAWDDVLWMAYVGNVIKVGSTYYLYYTGAKYNPTPDNGEFRAIGVATGSSLTSLTKYGSNPIIQYTTTGFTETEEGASRPTVYYDERTGIWHMWYAASRYTSPGNVDVDIRYRNSTDGLTWSNDTLVYQVSGDEYVPFACFYFNSQWNVYIIGPLSGGAGALRLLYGSTPTSMSMSLVDSGTFRGTGAINYLGKTKFGLYLSSNGSLVDVREIEGASPDSLSASIETFTPGTSYFGINVIIDGNLWEMIQLDGTGGADDGKIVLRTATVSRSTYEDGAWKVAGTS